MRCEVSVAGKTQCQKAYKQQVDQGVHSGFQCGDSVLYVHLQSTGVATAEQAQAIARLQKQLAESQDRRKLADESAASLRAEAAELRGELAAQAQNLAVQVSHHCHQLTHHSSL